MTSTANLTQAECAARAETVAPEEYLVELDLRGAPDPDSATFTSTTTITFRATSGADTWVDLIAMSVDRATLNGEDLDLGGYDGARLPVPGLAEHNELVVVAQCAFSRTGEGLHRFTDPEDDHTYLYTHFEPTDARRMFANFEQPDLKGRYTVRVAAPADWVVRSGQPETDRVEETHDGTRQATVTFAPTPPLSSYLVAVAAGPYHVATDEWTVTRQDGSTQDVPLMLLCRRAMAAHLDTDDIFEVTKQGLSFYDEKFEFPYPWGKYDQIFVPEYNLGAMENPGLVTFTETYLSRGHATAQEKARRAMVIMHEMAHMWFGDLATMRWWDGLWLKESFADLMGYHVCSAATRYDTAWASFALGRKAWAYRADQLPSTHPVVATIEDLEAARQNFDGITYAKGASVIKQLMAYVGEAEFFAGAARYFERHAFGSTELTDLLDCLEESSGRDLRAWSTAWLETTGVSTLTPLVERTDDGAIARLVVRQAGVDTPTGNAVLRPHRLRIGFYTADDRGLTRTRSVELDVTDGETEVPDAVGERADLVLLNDDDLTYAKVMLDADSLTAVREHLSTIDSNLSRSLIWSSLWNATRDGVLPAADFLAVVAHQIPQETEPLLVTGVLERARQALRSYLPAAQRDSANESIIDVAADGLREVAPGSDLQHAWARALADIAGDAPAGVTAVRSLLRTPPPGLEIDDDLRWALWTALAAQDSATTEELATELRRDPSMSGHTSCIEAKASRPTAEAKEQTWARITEGLDTTNDELRSLVAGFVKPSAGSLTQPYAPRYYASLIDWWRSRSQTMATIMASGLFPTEPLAPGERVEDNGALRAAATWLEENPEAPAALRRVISEQHDDLLRALRTQDSAPTLIP